jgi:hypothetical protein
MLAPAINFNILAKRVTSLLADEWPKRRLRQTQANRLDSGIRNFSGFIEPQEFKSTKLESFAATTVILWIGFWLSGNS